MGGWASILVFARAGRVGVEILSSKTGWAWVGARTRPALSEVLREQENRFNFKIHHSHRRSEIQTSSLAWYCPSVLANVNCFLMIFSH